VARITKEKRRTVAEIMSAPVVTASSSETIAQAAEQMRENSVGSVVVVGGERPIGILTERDLVRFAASGAEASVTKISEWMTGEPETVEPSTDVAFAFQKLADRGFRHIPVVDGGRLEGIVSMRDLMKIAQIQPAGSIAADIPRGLKGVVVAETAVGDVRGEEGFFHYRQYDATELARKRTLEDVWFLLLEGNLPNEAEGENFAQEVRSLREIPLTVREILPSLNDLRPDASLLDLLQAAYSVTVAAFDYGASLDSDRSSLRAAVLRTCAVMPTLTVALHRLRQGLEPLDPHPGLGHAANFLYMLTGEDPPPDQVRALEQYLILTADHGFNASTFTARVITSTGASLGSAVAGALGALSGPLHGGAPSRALDMLDAIGTPENADSWIRAAIERGDRLMGFGHAIYRTTDPRSIMLQEVAERLGGARLEFAKHVESRAVALLNKLKPGRRLYTNVEFYAAIVLDAAGLPREMFTPTFACSRVIGWTSHILEQALDNRIIRPSAHYVGPAPPEPVPAS